MEDRVAGALSFRLAQQSQWQLAGAVLDGRQPRVDPDGSLLEEIGDGIRTYRLQEAFAPIDGRQALVRRRLVKRLGPFGTWDAELVVDSYRHLSGPEIAVTYTPAPQIALAS